MATCLFNHPHRWKEDKIFKRCGKNDWMKINKPLSELKNLWITILINWLSLRCFSRLSIFSKNQEISKLESFRKLKMFRTKNFELKCKWFISSLYIHLYFLNSNRHITHQLGRVIKVKLKSWELGTKFRGWNS